MARAILPEVQSQTVLFPPADMASAASVLLCAPFTPTCFGQLRGADFAVQPDPPRPLVEALFRGPALVRGWHASSLPEPGRTQRALYAPCGTDFTAERAEVAAGTRGAAYVIRDTGWDRT